jgi:hypothetical protein
VAAEDEAARTRLRWEDVGASAAGRLGIHVTRVNWFSTYRVHHRVACRFRSGRSFLAGDAAHIHSPVGGQGMNTGIGDAVNLGWKLADVLRARAGATLLDSYEPERIAFARRLVATTDRAFTIATSPGPLARWLRLRIVPLVLPRLMALASVRRFAFRVVSQTAIRYRGSALAAGRLGPVQGGDRLPWVELGAGATDNHGALDGRDWQVHVYGLPGPGIAETCREFALALHVLEWRAAMHAAGLRRDGLYLVRPDGYVALACAAARPEPLVHFLQSLGRPAGRILG